MTRKKKGSGRARKWALKTRKKIEKFLAHTLFLHIFANNYAFLPCQPALAFFKYLLYYLMFFNDIK